MSTFHGLNFNNTKIQNEKQKTKTKTKKKQNNQNSLPQIQLKILTLLHSKSKDEIKTIANGVTVRFIMVESVIF